MGCCSSKKDDDKKQKNTKDNKKEKRKSLVPLKEIKTEKKEEEKYIPKERILLITDPGRDIDDTVALQIIAGSQREIELVGIITSGGRTKERAALARAWCNLMTMPSSIPVGCCSEQKGSGGVWMPAEFRMLRTKDLHISELGGDDLILEIVKKYKGEVIIVAIAPLTPLAQAIKKDAETIRSGVKAFYFQGQAKTTNDSHLLVPNSEAFNIREDPESAKVVFDNLQDVVPFVLLGKHAAYQVGLEKKHFGVHSMESQVREILTAFRRSDRAHFARVYPVPKEKDTEEGWYDALEVVSHPYDPLLLLYLLRSNLFAPQYIGIDNKSMSSGPPLSKTNSTSSTNPAYTSSASELPSLPGSASDLFSIKHTLIGNTAEFHGIPDSGAVRKLLIDRMNAGLKLIPPKETDHQ